MKNALLFFSLFLVIACKKESASNEAANDPVQIDAVVLGKGTFQNGPYGRVICLAMHHGSKL
jgi:hypothetical protein